MNNVKKSSTEPSLKQGFASYFKGVKAEWGKVSWPERRQVIVETIIVIAVVFFFTTLVYLIDLIFKGALSLIPSR